VIPLWAKIAGPIALIAALIVGFKFYVASIRADERREVTSEFTAAQQKAEIADLKKTLATERQQNAITEESNAKQVADLANANSSLSAYIARLRTSGGGVGQGKIVPGTADAANLIIGADRLSILDDDLRKCTAIAVRLGNAKEWAERQAKVER